MVEKERSRGESKIPELAQSMQKIEGSLGAPQELAVMARIRRFLDDVSDKIESTELAAVADALSSTIALHSAQEREPGVPYYRHPLLVTIMAAQRFNLPVDPLRLILALYHAVPEDQADRVGHLFEMKRTRYPSDAIEAIAERYSTVIPAGRIREGLELLTNPDFGALVQALFCKGEGNPPAIFEHAKLCRDLGREPPGDPTRLETVELGRFLYLGHFREIRESSSEAFQIKLADFYSNGLHLHLLKRTVDNLNPGDRDSQLLERKLQKLTRKYEPVIAYLSHEFDCAKTQGITILGSREADSWYRKKLSYAEEHCYHKRSAIAQPPLSDASKDPNVGDSGYIGSNR
jgi:hypothetical protein